jgi:hypothetical protein
MLTRSTQNLLPGLLAFLGLGALGGGGVLVVSPSGKLMGMPLSLLQHSPFTTFLIPGLILFLVLGVTPCLIAYALLKKPASPLAERLNLISDMHWAWTFCLYCAFALIFWLQIEMMFLQAVGWLHTFYMFFAVVLISCALLPRIRNLYKKISKA